MRAVFKSLAIVGLTLFASSCGSVVREGAGTSFLIINAMQAASGARPEEFSGFLMSDVVTVVDDVPSLFNDAGRVTLSLGLKDPGSATSPSEPTQNQFITISQYRVRFIRSDGRNTPGVDVPYPFDGGLTMTVGRDPVTVGFELVRHVAKQEAPLATLAASPVIINTVAEITFYGRDITGREVSVTGRITVDFGNFADPQS